MIIANDCFGEMLAMITSSFLKGSKEGMLESSFLQTSERYTSAMTSLTTNLREAKFEQYVLGLENEYRIEAELVICMQRLAHSIGGLRSAAAMQFSLLSQSVAVCSRSPTRSGRSSAHEPLPSITSTAEEFWQSHTAVDEESEARSDRVNSIGSANDVDEHLDHRNAHLAVDVWAKFIRHLGPSMVFASSLHSAFPED